MMESLSLGPILFSAPLALLALIGLPLLWFILRATPPQPRTADLPSLVLFEDLAHREETPDKTPWWIILLRVLAITLAILGLARPVWSPPTEPTSDARGDVLLMLDNGWMSAPDFSARQSAALDLLSGIDLDRGVYLLPTTSATPEQALKSRLTVQETRSRVRALKPMAWSPDYTALHAALSGFDGQSPETLWVSSAQSFNGFDELTAKLKDMGPVSVVPLTPKSLITIDALATSNKGPVLSLTRPNDEADTSLTLTARDENGRSVGSVQGSFDKGQSRTDVTFDMPDDVQATISSFKILGQPSAGSVWYWEGSSRARRVGLISGSQSIQPLLTDTYYVKKALSPFATIYEGELDELLAQDLNAIILTDIGRLSDTDETSLRDWVEQGNVLIRFAGPRMAAQTDALIPVQLRRASRAFDSALSWDSPQKLSGFPETSPFATAPLSSDVHVRRQVLAQPGPELASKTWARLEDGTPLVTADRLGDGRLILFHVTAGPDWSDLPLSGTFVELLRRVTLPARDLGTLNLVAETSLAPRFWLDGYGSVISPAGNAKPIQPDNLSTLKPSADYPAGVYEGSAVSFPLNAAKGFSPDPVTKWPDGIIVTSAEARSGQGLSGLLLLLAGLLLLIDLIVSLIIAGKLGLSDFRKSGAALILIAAMGASTLSLPPEAIAQEDSTDEDMAIPEAALDLRFGYLLTGDSDLNSRAEAGLRGLSYILFRRTTVEPEPPLAIDLETSPLDLYPLIYILMPNDGLTLNDMERDNLAAYMKNGGAVIIDTMAGGRVTTGNSIDNRLVTLLEGLDLPPLKRVNEDHVLTRSFYLIDGFSGRYPDRPLWIEGVSNGEENTKLGDGISSIYITDADFASAWAINNRNRPLYSVEGGERNREMSYRTGVNIVMYILTGNYKDDQVHIPSLLDRLGEITGEISIDGADPVDVRPETEGDNE